MRVRETFKELSLISIHTPTNDKNEEETEQFYKELIRVRERTSFHIANFRGSNAKIGKEVFYYSAVSKYILIYSICILFHKII